MPAPLRSGLKPLLLFFVIMLSALQSQASHVFGVDLYYVHVTGNTYTIHLVIYGDCSGSAFPSLPDASPVISVYNGDTHYTDVSLSIQAPTDGVEVTPVCAADAGSTTCSVPGSTIPGIKKFVYTGNVTVSGASSDWRFLFQGNMGTGVASAGRSNSITNIVIPPLSGSLIQLVDTLNNTTYDNNSAVYNTIPTPFFCINIPANFNPATVDPDGDSLVFYLVPAIDGNTGSSVTYVSPYTATAPLSVTTGTFSFSSSTGQLSFTPNAVQKSLVVYNVEEYHAGVLRGTTQREMSVVVISPCTNNPPTGSISAPSTGTVADSTQFDICSSAGAFSFHLNPTDPDLDTITMTVSGLPAGATLDIVDNSTPSPLGTFTWNTTGIAPGNYTFYVTYRDNGCPLSSTQTLAYTITIYPTPTQTYAQTAAATCVRKGVFQVTPGGSFSPYTIKILEGATLVQTITGVTGAITDSLLPGTYTIYTYNPDNCFADTTITIASPTLPDVAAGTTPPLCPGGATGTATISASSGLAPYEYAIGTGAFSASGTFTGLTAGTYTVYARDANGCVKDTVVTVATPTPIWIHAGVLKPLCNNFADGTIAATAYNSTGPYTYALGAGAFGTSGTFTGLAAGTYTIAVKNANGCIADTTITLADSENIHASLVVANAPCNGSDGIITVGASGGYGPPYTYAYNSGPFGVSDIFTLPAGSYTLHVTDPEACFFDTTVSITQPSPGIITTSLTNVSCNGGSNGSVVVAVTGGTPLYLYSVNGGAFSGSDVLAGLSAGAQDIAVEDANGCVYNDTVTLSQPSPLIITSVSAMIPACYAGTNGSFTIAATGGTPGYTYTYNTSPYTAADVLGGLGAGAYTLYVKDTNGCITDTALSLSQPPLIVPDATVFNPVCNTIANGQVTLSAEGGTPGYTYAMGAGGYGASGVFSSLAAGTYTFDIKDANGCIRDTIVTLTDSLHISCTAVVTAALCFDAASGSITVNGVGGSSPYTYAMGAGAYGPGDFFNGLAAGSYNVNIKDANGCTDDTTLSVTQPANITPEITVTDPACYGQSNGSCTVTATGGTPAYTYSFDNGAFTGSTTYAALTAGTDSVMISDANGCRHDTVFTIGQPSQLLVGSLAWTNISCNGGADGTVTINGAGATPPYQYAANTSSFQASSLLTGLAAGPQTIYVMDNNGCQIDTTVTLTQPAPLVFTGADTVNPTCQGYTDGSATLFVAGGTLPYSYSLDNVTFQPGNTFSAIGEGTYTFYVKDSNNCGNDTSVTFTGLPHILIDAISYTEPACYGYDNGSLTIAGSGGVQPLYYSIGSGLPAAADTFSALASATYELIITDSRNCKKDTSEFLPQPNPLVIDTAVTPNTCIGLDTKGGAQTTVTGGTAPYSYMWNTNPVITASYITGLPNGFYTVWVTDTNNCQDSATVQVTYDDCCTPFIPNAFTPNNDGKDDIFRIRFKGDMSIIIFSVYNRFGQMVYSVSNTSDADQGWDGKFNGIPADLGTYFYYAKIICGNKGDHIEELKGDVILVR